MSDDSEETPEKPKALPTNRELAEASAERIRDAGKWLIASFAGVGAALIAGSQLSSIGQLNACWPPIGECARLWLALLGAVGGLAAVVWAIWTAVSLFAPPHIPPNELAKLWRGRRSPIYEYFTGNPSYFQGFVDFDDISAREKDFRDQFGALGEEFDQAKSDAERKRIAGEMKRINDDLEATYRQGDEVVTLANRLVREDAFRRKALPKLMVSAVVAALGIGLFAWAANPPNSDEVPLRTIGPREGQVVYRVYGGEADTFGESWTPVDPTLVGSASFRIAAGIPDRLNGGTFLVWGSLDSPESVALVRQAIRVTSTDLAYCPPYAGGLVEYVIPDAEEHVQVIGIVALDPDYGGDPGSCP